MTEIIKEIRLQNRMTTADVSQSEYIKQMIYRLNNKTNEPDEKTKRMLRKLSIKREIEAMLR